MNKKDPENIIGKIELLLPDYEQFSKEYNELSKDPEISEYLKGLYTGISQAFGLVAKTLTIYLKGTAWSN